jgi:hypothetical protein
MELSQAPLIDGAQLPLREVIASDWAAAHLHANSRPTPKASTANQTTSLLLRLGVGSGASANVESFASYQQRNSRTKAVNYLLE